MSDSVTNGTVSRLESEALLESHWGWIVAVSRLNTSADRSGSLPIDPAPSLEAS